MALKSQYDHCTHKIVYTLTVPGLLGLVVQQEELKTRHNLGEESVCWNDVDNGAFILSFSKARYLTSKEEADLENDVRQTIIKNGASVRATHDIIPDGDANPSAALELKDFEIHYHGTLEDDQWKRMVDEFQLAGYAWTHCDTHPGRFFIEYECINSYRGMVDIDFKASDNKTVDILNNLRAIFKGRIWYCYYPTMGVLFCCIDSVEEYDAEWKSKFNNAIQSFENQADDSVALAVKVAHVNTPGAATATHSDKSVLLGILGAKHTETTSAPDIPVDPKTEAISPEDMATPGAGPSTITLDESVPSQDTDSAPPAELLIELAKLDRNEFLAGPKKAPDVEMKDGVVYFEGIDYSQFLYRDKTPDLDAFLMTEDDLEYEDDKEDDDVIFGDGDGELDSHAAIDTPCMPNDPTYSAFAGFDAMNASASHQATTPSGMVDLKTDKMQENISVYSKQTTADQNAQRLTDLTDALGGVSIQAEVGSGSTVPHETAEDGDLAGEWDMVDRELPSV